MKTYTAHSRIRFYGSTLDPFKVVLGEGAVIEWVSSVISLDVDVATSGILQLDVCVLSSPIGTGPLPVIPLPPIAVNTQQRDDRIMLRHTFGYNILRDLTGAGNYIDAARYTDQQFFPFLNIPVPSGELWHGYRLQGLDAEVESDLIIGYSIQPPW